MILRRLIDHVKAQNWTAIFLDFVIVVLVFVGMQVNDWNAARHAPDGGLRFLTLATDLT